MIPIFHNGKPINLEGPLFVELINCVTVQDRMAFVDKHGELLGSDVPFATGAAAEVEVAFADRLRETAEFLLAVGEEGPAPGRTKKAFLQMANMLLLQGVSITPRLAWTEGSTRFVFEVPSLAGFMALELATAVEVGARTRRCERCDKLFLHGPLTGRRSTARYCAKRCQRAAMRAARTKGDEA